MFVCVNVFICLSRDFEDFNTQTSLQFICQLLLRYPHNLLGSLYSTYPHYMNGNGFLVFFSYSPQKRSSEAAVCRPLPEGSLLSPVDRYLSLGSPSMLCLVPFRQDGAHGIEMSGP